MGDILFLSIIVLPFTFALHLTTLPYFILSQGHGMLFLWFHGTFQTDNGALFFGNLLGRNKAFPNISPNKTIEGLIGGYLFALMSTYILIQAQGFWILPVLPTYHFIVISIMVRYK